MASHATIVSSTIPQLPKESILDGNNYLDWELRMDYARNTHQELIMVHLDLEKANDHVNWPFVFGLMHTMGFGPRMSCRIFLLG